MSGIIDFSTSCPWQLYTFAFIHLLGGIFMYIFDVCYLVFPTKNQSCVGSEIVMSRMVALSLLYVGVVYTVLTYHSKELTAKVTRLSNFAMNAATALLVGIIFAGNKSLGGFERSWMHFGDMLTAFILIGILAARVSEENAVWANSNSFGDGLGINCKALLLIFTVITFAKILAFTDFVDPSLFLAGGIKMTKLAHCLWSFVIVLMFEILLGLFYSLRFDDDLGHELIIYTVAFMTLIGLGSIYPISDYMSGMYDFSTKGIWIMLGIVLGLCAVAVVGGRMGRRSGYQGVGGEGTSLNV